jgi:hypothetical protein
MGKNQRMLKWGKSLSRERGGMNREDTKEPKRLTFFFLCELCCLLFKTRLNSSFVLTGGNGGNGDGKTRG